MLAGGSATPGAAALAFAMPNPIVGAPHDGEGNFAELGSGDAVSCFCSSPEGCFALSGCPLARACAPNAGILIAAAGFGRLTSLDIADEKGMALLGSFTSPSGS